MKWQFKTISLAGLEPFARGTTAECYRLDDETILKLYYRKYPESRVQLEKKRAREALIVGIPTAISFDMVQVEDRSGVIYEAVNGPTVSEQIIAQPATAFETGKICAQIASVIHSAEGRKTGLPPASEKYRIALQKQDYLPKSTVSDMEAFLDELDQENRYVHGDFNTNNIILTPDGPIFIDIGMLSTGSPLFDMATVCFSLFESPEAVETKDGGRSRFSGLSRRECLVFWDGLRTAYFHGEPENETAERLRKIVLLRKMRFEILKRNYLSPEYCQSVRDEVRKVF